MLDDQVSAVSGKALRLGFLLGGLGKSELDEKFRKGPRLAPLDPDAPGAPVVQPSSFSEKGNSACIIHEPHGAYAIEKLLSAQRIHDHRGYRSLLVLPDNVPARPFVVAAAVGRDDLGLVRRELRRIKNGRPWQSFDRLEWPWRLPPEVVPSIAWDSSIGAIDCAVVFKKAHH